MTPKQIAENWPECADAVAFTEAMNMPPVLRAYTALGHTPDCLLATMIKTTLEKADLVPAGVAELLVKQMETDSYRRYFAGVLGLV